MRNKEICEKCEKFKYHATIRRIFNKFYPTCSRDLLRNFENLNIPSEPNGDITIVETSPFYERFLPETCVYYFEQKVANQ